MSIPAALKEAIEKEIENINLREISKARVELTERYRHPKAAVRQFMKTKIDHAAYIAARLPATYAVIKRVLEEIELCAPESSIQSLVDLGCGPGSAMWAACEVFSEIERIHLVEQDHELASLGKRLASYSSTQAIQEAQWKLQDVSVFKEFPQDADLIVLSYLVGELPSSVMDSVIKSSWDATKKFLVVIEPGTPAGFLRIRKIREQLIQAGAHLLAPCPHALECPITEGDWCHFSKRLERSALHRRLKEGSLSYEDEKFSYLIVSRTSYPLPQSRVLRHPIKKPRHIVFSLCTQDEGLKQEVVSKKDGEFYRKAKKLEWGSSFFTR